MAVEVGRWEKTWCVFFCCKHSNRPKKSGSPTRLHDFLLLDCCLTCVTKNVTRHIVAKKQVVHEEPCLT